MSLCACEAAKPFEKQNKKTSAKYLMTIMEIESNFKAVQ